MSGKILTPEAVQELLSKAADHALALKGLLAKVDSYNKQPGHPSWWQAETAIMSGAAASVEQLEEIVLGQLEDISCWIARGKPTE